MRVSSWCEMEKGHFLQDLKVRMESHAIVY